MRYTIGKKLNVALLALSVGIMPLTACNRSQDPDNTSDTEDIKITETTETQDTTPTDNTAPGPIINPTDTSKSYFDEGLNASLEINGYKSYGGQTADMFLSPGDKVAVLSPSSLPSQEQYDATIEGLTAWGYVPVPGKHVLQADRTLEDCREDLITALNDPEITAIFCVRGGYGSSEVMDLMTEDLISTIRNSNKLIIGFSDITVYHAAWSVAQVPSIHATMSGSFMTLSDECVEAEKNMLSGNIPSYRCTTDEYCIPGEATGVLIGGNLSTLTAVINTAYDCTKTGTPYILFVEEIGEDIQHIHRFLEVLDHAGVLANAQGIVFGEWTEIPSDFGGYGGDSRGGEFKSVEDMISREFLMGYNKPVAFGFPAGHSEEINYPLLMGVEAKVVVSDGSFTIDWTGAR
ncbi:MAG: LD-carboxypeptidase [Clostridiales bacterium]|nr:LD-carboxypeptidase [Clostridiales bacterium]